MYRAWSSGRGVSWYGQHPLLQLLALRPLQQRLQQATILVDAAVACSRVRRCAGRCQCSFLGKVKPAGDYEHQGSLNAVSNDEAPPQAKQAQLQPAAKHGCKEGRGQPEMVVAHSASQTSSTRLQMGSLAACCRKGGLEREAARWQKALT